MNYLKNVLLEIKTGVPQGSIFGRLLFLLFVNDIILTVSVLNFQNNWYNEKVKTCHSFWHFVFCSASL